MAIQTLVAVTFDCYGTLVDWEAGIRGLLERICREKGVDADPRDLLQAREDIEFELIQGEYRSYREILAVSLRDTFARFGIPYAKSDGERLAESVPEWPVFTETRPALERLARISRLAIISNIDDDIIEKTKARIGVRFHVTVTAQQARAYKPSTKPFQLALEKLGCKPDQVLHVSSGFRYDIPPAHSLGFQTAWVNRKGEHKPEGVQADHEFSNLIQLAEFIENLG